jgi:serine/threonine-protein kinase
MALSEGSALPIGTVVNKRYTIMRVVGQGGLGTVYQVRESVYGQNNIYALKELIDQTKSARKQFLQEAKWLQTLNDPHIPKVRDYFEWEQRLYLVMDFVDGENLDQKLRRLGGRGLPESQVLAWILPICTALHHLHTRQPPLLHRDVKPSNIIVTPAGHPVLVDLGIAKEHRAGANQTATFVRKAGTEGYAPPEQYTSAGQAGPWSDVYSLGATMYELLTGCIPPTAVERVALDVRLVPLRELNPEISPHVADAILRSLAIRPADRYQLMADFAAALMGPDTTGLRLPTMPRSVPNLSRPLGSQSGGQMPAPPTPRVGMSGPSAPSAPSRPALTLPAELRTPTPPGYPSAPNLPGATGRVPSSQAGGAGTASAPRLGSGVSSGGLRDSAGAEERRHWYSLPIVWIAGTAVFLVIAAVVTVAVLGVFTPLDRSSPQATISGYFQALEKQENARAWHFSADSQNQPATQGAFVEGLQGDDQRFGRVVNFQVTALNTEASGHALATVTVKRANAPDTPMIYQVNLTQYGGAIWLIDSITGS